MTAKEVSKIQVAKERFNKMIDILSLEDIETISLALEELEAIKSADGGEAMEELEKIGNILATGGAVINQTDRYETVKNYILKSQAQERELVELRDSNNELRRLLDEAYSKIPKTNYCCKGSEE